MKKITYSVFAAALFAVACNETNPSSSPLPKPTVSATFKNVQWLSGRWEGVAPGVKFGESWETLNDSVLSGKGFFVVGADTVSSETLRLVAEGENLFYEPTVKNQNDGKAVRFKLTSQTENSLVFENPAHDFPQKISYLLLGPDSLQAEISGVQEGKARSEQFPMHRVP